MNEQKNRFFIKHEIELWKNVQDASGQTFLLTKIQSLLQSEDLFITKTDVLVNQDVENINLDKDPNNIVKALQNRINKSDPKEELGFLVHIQLLQLPDDITSNKALILAGRVLTNCFVDCDYHSLVVVHHKSICDSYVVHIIATTVNTQPEKGKIDKSTKSICEQSENDNIDYNEILKCLRREKGIIDLKDILDGFDIGNISQWRINKSFAKQFLQYTKKNDIKLSVSSGKNKQPKIEYQFNDISIKESELDYKYSLQKICEDVKSSLNFSLNSSLDYSKVLKIIERQKTTIKSLLFSITSWLVFFIIIILCSKIIWLQMDKTVRLNLPNKLSDVPIRAYDSKGQTCEVAKIVSLDKPIHTIKCNKQWGIWPLGVKHFLIGGYKPIDFQSLQKDGNAVYKVQEQELEKISKWPVFFNRSEKNGLPFKSKKVNFFDSEQDCKKTRNPHDKVYLVHRKLRTDNLPKVTKQPVWGKVVSHENDLSYCAKGEPRIDEAQNFYVTFSFQRKTLTGKRKAVVIAPSHKLSSRGMGTVITETLGNWLVKLKSYNTKKVPVTIFLIGVDGSVTSLVRTEDLVNMYEEGDNSILAKMDEIEFISNDFGSLSNLRAVDDKLKNRFDRVLYLTDGNISGYRGSVTAAIKTGLGIPKHWYDNDVYLSVLTNGKCNFWEKHAKAECFILNKKKTAKQQFMDKLNQLTK